MPTITQSMINSDPFGPLAIARAKAAGAEKEGFCYVKRKECFPFHGFVGVRVSPVSKGTILKDNAGKDVIVQDDSVWKADAISEKFCEPNPVTGYFGSLVNAIKFKNSLV
jgi:hypothetical protein